MQLIPSVSRFGAEAAGASPVGCSSPRNKKVAWLLLLIAATSRAICTADAQQSSLPISYFIFIVQENHSFDNYFGTYPGANGIPGGTQLAWLAGWEYYGNGIKAPLPNPALVQLVNAAPTPAVRPVGTTKLSGSHERLSPNGFADDEDPEAPVAESGPELPSANPKGSPTPPTWAQYAVTLPKRATAPISMPTWRQSLRFPLIYITAPCLRSAGLRRPCRIVSIRPLMFRPACGM